jgi:hypothetical protein
MLRAWFTCCSFTTERFNSMISKIPSKCYWRLQIRGAQSSYDLVSNSQFEMHQFDQWLSVFYLNSISDSLERPLNSLERPRAKHANTVVRQMCHPAVKTAPQERMQLYHSRSTWCMCNIQQISHLNSFSSATTGLHYAAFVCLVA